MAAWLLWKHGLTIDKLFSHTYWVNKSVGKHFTDVDRQCTNPVRNQKWCPTYIFGSSNPDTALKNWKAFKQLVQGYMDALTGGAQAPAPDTAGTLYRVQTGAFSSKANAAAYAKKLKAAGFDTYVVKADGLYKVQVGAYSKKANAEAQMQKLTTAGFQAFVTTKSGTPA